jgi:hypothetical protein
MALTIFVSAIFSPLILPYYPGRRAGILRSYEEGCPTQKDVKSLMWDLFQNSGVPQYYALYAALKYDEDEEKERHAPPEEDERLR